MICRQRCKPVWLASVVILMLLLRSSLRGSAIWSAKLMRKDTWKYHSFGMSLKNRAYLLEMVLGITYSLPCCQSLRIALLPGIYRFLLAPDSARYLSADAKKFLVDKGIRLRLEWSYCCCFFFLFQCDIDMLTV